MTPNDRICYSLWRESGCRRDRSVRRIFTPAINPPPPFDKGGDEAEEFEEVWTGDYIFGNEWQSFRTKKDRKLELTSVYHECRPGRRKLAVKVVDIFGADTMTIVEVKVGKNGEKK